MKSKAINFILGAIFLFFSYKLVNLYFVAGDKGLNPNFIFKQAFLKQNSIERDSAYKSEDWRQKTCEWSSERKLDPNTVAGRVSSRNQSALKEEGAQNWSDVLAKDKLNSDQTLVWLQTTIWDIASSNALEDVVPSFRPEDTASIKYYASLLFQLCQKGIHSSWAQSCSQWQKIYHNPQELIGEIRSYWQLVKQGKCY